MMFHGSMEKEQLNNQSAGQNTETDQLFALGYEKKLRGEYADAVKIFEDLCHEVQRDENAAQRKRIMLEAARLFLLLGKYSRARTYAQGVLDYYPDEIEAIVILGKAAMGEYQFDSARGYFKDLPHNAPERHLGLCTVALKERRLAQAQESLVEAAKLVDDDNPEYAILWAYVQFLNGSHKEALAQVREVMSDPPHDTNLLMLAAEIFMASGTYGEAKKVTVLVNKFAPEHDHAFAVRSYALLAEEEYKGAEKEAYKALKFNKKNAYALTTLMKCATREGDYATAETYGLRILHDTPSYGLGHANLGDVYFNQGKYEMAHLEYNQCKFLMDSLTKGALLRKARLAYIEGNTVGAIDILRKLIESHHSYYDDAMCDLALCYDRLGEIENKNDILERMELRRAMYHRTESVMEQLA